MSGKATSSQAKPSPSKKKETIQAAHTGSAASASSSGKEQSKLKSLKIAKNEKDAEMILKQIRQQIEGSEKLKKFYLDGDIVKDTVDLLKRYEGIYLIEYFSICLLCDLIYDIDGKEKMMKESIHKIVLKIMKQNMKDQHLQCEGCKLLKKLMIKTSYAIDISFVDAVDFIKDIIKIHKTELKVMIEAYKCLKFLTQIDERNSEMQKYLLDVILFLMKNNKQNFDILSDCITDLRITIQALDDEEYLLKSDFIQTVFQACNKYLPLNLSKAAVELIELMLRHLEKKNMKFKLEIAGIFVDTMKEQQLNENVALLCMKMLIRLSLDEIMKKELLKISADRYVSMATNKKYPMSKDHNNSATPISPDFVKLSVPAIYLGLQYLNIYSQDPGMQETLIEHEVYRNFYDILEYTYTDLKYADKTSEQIYENILSLFNQWLDSPNRDLVLEEAIKLREYVIFGNYPKPRDLYFLKVGFHILTSKTEQEKVFLAKTRIQRNPYFQIWMCSIEELKCVGRVIGYKESFDYFVPRNYYKSILYELNGGGKTPEYCSIAIWLLSKLVLGEGAVLRSDEQRIIDIANHILVLYPEYQSTFGLIHQPTRFYCQEILSNFQATKNEDTNIDMSSSIMIKSAATATSRKD